MRKRLRISQVSWGSIMQLPPALSAMSAISIALRAPAEPARQYLTFECGDRLVGVDARTVREIRGWSPLVHRPGLAAEARGVLELGDRTITVYDLSLLTALPPANCAPVIIVVSHRGSDLGLMASAIADIVYPAADEFWAAAESEAPIAGFIRRHGRVASILSLDALFPHLAEVVYLD